MASSNSESNGLMDLPLILFSSNLRAQWTNKGTQNLICAIDRITNKTSDCWIGFSLLSSFLPIAGFCHTNATFFLSFFLNVKSTVKSQIFLSGFGWKLIFDNPKRSDLQNASRGKSPLCVQAWVKDQIGLIMSLFEGINLISDECVCMRDKQHSPTKNDKLQVVKLFSSSCSLCQWNCRNIHDGDGDKEKNKKCYDFINLQRLIWQQLRKFYLIRDNFNNKSYCWFTFKEFIENNLQIWICNFFIFLTRL